MKVLLFGEYSGLFNNLKDGLVKIGHQVFLASSGDGSKNFPSDFKFKTNKKLGKFSFAYQMADIYKNKNLFKGFDVVMIISPNMFTRYALPNRMMYKFLKNNNDKIFLSGAGISGILFDYWYEKEEEKYHKYMSGYIEKLQDPTKFRCYKNNKLKKWEMELYEMIDGYIPIWYEYAEPFRSITTIKKTIPIPINIDEIKYSPNIINDKIIFFHGLAERSVKGHQYILGAFDQLRNKYKEEAEFVCEGGLPISEYMKLLDKTNVVLDDANSYSLGMNALFSMAKGKIVMGGAEPVANAELGYSYNPAINLQPSIKQVAGKIEYIIEHKSEIEEMGRVSRQFVEDHHDYVKIAEEYVNVWQE